MKNKVILLIVSTLSAFTVSTLAEAANVGPYAGLGAGVGRFDSPGEDAFIVSGAGSTSSHTQGGLSGRAFVGFNYLCYLGIEAGFTRYARSRYRGAEDGTYSSISYYGRAGDLVGKLYLPFGHTGFNIYGLAGAARVSVTTHYTDNGVPLSGAIADPNDGITHTYKTRPIYGAGISYDFGNRITANVEYTQIRHLGHFETNAYAIPNMNLATANLAYNFG